MKNPQKIFDSNSPAFIIAEIGVNHNGDVGLAKCLIDQAKSAGADAVKFQTFTASSLAALDTPKVKYQEATVDVTESHYQMLQRLELDHESHLELFVYCKELGIEFLSTPYDINSAEFLSSLGVNFFKTASADIVDLPLHSYIASTGKLSIVAVGMASLGEVEKVVDIYQNAGNFNLALLHAVSNYPASDSSLNMRVMSTLANSFQVPVGFSDHSEGFLAAVIAVSHGAKIIEKHFTLDRHMEGPDHKASSTPSEFAEYVQNIRRAELMLGSPRKVQQAEEAQMAMVSRKSIVFSKTITAGSIISKADLKLQRPGDGILSQHLNDFIGQTLSETVTTGTQARWSHLKSNRT
jgi:N,N'-diacetyllegionaminate synthase